MSKRYFPSLEGLDNGEAPVLGIRERADLADLNSPIEGYVVEEPIDYEPTTLSELFDSYED